MQTPEPFTAEHNDTLGGLLYEFEREEEKHLRRKIGYWRMVEERMIRNRLMAEGWMPDDPRMVFEISRRVTENHRGQPTLRERQEHHRARRQAAPASPDERFTVDELDRLCEHFAGANDPVAQSILAKAMATLGRR